MSVLRAETWHLLRSRSCEPLRSGRRRRQNTPGRLGSLEPGCKLNAVSQVRFSECSACPTRDRMLPSNDQEALIMFFEAKNGCLYPVSRIAAIHPAKDNTTSVE